MFSTVDLREPDNNAIAVTSQGAHIVAASTSGVSNLLGDFDNDVDIDTRDFALLSTYWKPVNNSTGDIGPATGTPPMLTPVPDGKVNFEDLFVFARMWNWFHSTHRGTGGGFLAKSMASLEWQISEQGSDAKTIRLELWAYDIAQLAMGHLIVRYDATGLKYKSAGAGKLLTEGESTVAFFADDNQNNGKIDVALSRLPSEGQSPEVNGSGAIITLEFERANASVSPVVSLHTLDLRSSDNASISVGSAPELSLDGMALPASYELGRNYPNPFNSRTKMSFQLPNASHVKIQILNILGQPIRTLANGRFDAGSHQVAWDGKNDSGQQVISGIYIVRMEAGSFRQAREMLFVK